MTKDEIKKAFEICCGVQDCTGCPILDMEKQNGHGCKFNLFTRVIDTVSEQEKEIERLKANGYRSIMDAFENNRDKIVENIQTEIDDYKQSIKQAKIDVLNKVKERAVGLAAIETYHICNLIDELIKEVQNGEDKG